VRPPPAHLLPVARDLLQVPSRTHPLSWRTHYIQTRVSICLLHDQRNFIKPAPYRSPSRIALPPPTPWHSATSWRLEMRANAAPLSPICRQSVQRNTIITVEIIDLNILYKFLVERFLNRLADWKIMRGEDSSDSGHCFNCGGCVFNLG
jgi:hypothetical protein